MLESANGKSCKNLQAWTSITTWFWSLDQEQTINRSRSPETEDSDRIGWGFTVQSEITKYNRENSWAREWVQVNLLGPSMTLEFMASYFKLCLIDRHSCVSIFMQWVGDCKHVSFFLRRPQQHPVWGVCFTPGLWMLYPISSECTANVLAVTPSTMWS